MQKHDLTLWCLNVIFGEASAKLLEDELLLYELSLKSRRRLTALVESQRADFEQKHHSRFSLRERLWGNTFGLDVPVDRWINDSLSFIWTTRGDSLRTKGGFCNVHCPPPVYSLAPFPISDCESRLHLPVVSRVYFGGGSPRHFCFFMNRLLCGRRGLGVKAFSVSVSMCALYSSVCVYASVSYGCFFPQFRVWKRMPSMWMCHCVQHLGQVVFLILNDAYRGEVFVCFYKTFFNLLTWWSCQRNTGAWSPVRACACYGPARSLLINSAQLARRVGPVHAPCVCARAVWRSSADV